MSQITDTGRVHTITGQLRDLDSPHVDQEIMQSVTGLIPGRRRFYCRVF